VRHGDLVGVALLNCVDHIYAVFGVWKAGGNALPIRWDLSLWERARLLRVAGPKVVVGA
jgi:bile acid-coenzyme A ligase